MSDTKDEKDHVLMEHTVDGAFIVPYPPPGIAGPNHLVDGHGMPISVSDNTVDVSWETPGHNANEIKALKKEIQELKDMIAEHILLGHQEKS